MSQQLIITTPANTQLGDSPKAAFDKVNANFSEVYLLAQGLAFSGTDSGTTNSYVVTVSGFPAALTTGLTALFVPTNTNTGPSTVNVGGTGAQPVVNWFGAALTGGEINGETLLRWNGTAWQLVASATPVGFQRAAAEVAAGVTPTSYSSNFGTYYRYGAKGKAGRAFDVTFSGAVMTSPGGGFANAKAGQVAVVVDGGALRTGGRPAPLITTILSVQSANQITLSAAPSAPYTVTMTGTLNGTASVTGTSVNPITSGIGLTRSWTVSGTGIVGGTQVTATTSSTLTISPAASGSGAQTLTLTAPIEVCFGTDDSTAILAALSLPFPITDVLDNFLVTQTLGVAASATGGAGCNNISTPSALYISAISGNASHCVVVTGVDRGNLPTLVGLRYLPVEVDMGEVDCCNSGLDGFSLGPSMGSRIRARITNAYRNALGEFFLTGGTWQEGNSVYINCGRAGLHFHHKVTKSNSSYQNLGSYIILGRSPGLNSVFLGINAGTQPDQCGGAVRLYSSGNTVADGGMQENTWGSSQFNEFDGERSVALSFGSDICSSAITFVDVTQSYVIEGAASSAGSNNYLSNSFDHSTIEDISQTSDVRGGYQFYAMTNTNVTGLTVGAVAPGSWGQTYANQLILAGADDLVRWRQRLSYPGILLLGDQQAGGAATKFFAAGYLGLPANTQASGYTLVASDNGKVIQMTSGGAVTVPQNIFVQNNVVSVIAFGAGCTVAQGTGVTLSWYNGTTLVTGTRTVANGGSMDIVFQSATTALVTRATGVT